MSILFECPACGKATQAPEEMVGQRAKCPHCLAVIDVPRPADPAAEPTVTYVPPPASASPPAAGDGLPRRPGPACGAVVGATAAKCDTCGAALDPALASRVRRGSRDESLEAIDYILAFVPCLSLFGCVVGVLYLIQGRSKGIKMVLLSVVMSVIWVVSCAKLRPGRPHLRRFGEARPALLWRSPATVHALGIGDPQSDA